VLIGPTQIDDGAHTRSLQLIPAGCIDEIESFCADEDA